MSSKKLLAPVFSSLVACASLVGFSDDANACSPPRCSGAQVAPREIISPSDPPSNPVIPSSTAAFPFVPSRDHLDSSDAGDQVFRLLDPTGNELATTVQDDPRKLGGKLLVPSAPLTEGKGYKLTYIESCTSISGSGDPAPVDKSFDVGAASALPSVAGTLDAASPELARVNLETASGSCFEEVDAVGVEVRLTPSAELRAFAPLTRFEILVDGHEHGARHYGVYEIDGEKLSVATLYAACKPDEHPHVGGLLSLGEHVITVRAHVAGAESDPPELTTKVTLSCPGEIPDGEDGGVTGSDAGVTTETPDASPPGSNASPSGESAGGGGCSTTGGSTSLFGSGGALLAGVALALRARSVRRRR